jgi:hypothetical protein
LTQAETETIETFCRELAQALHRITGKTIEIKPALLITPIENDQQPDRVQTLLGDRTDRNKQDL